MNRLEEIEHKHEQLRAVLEETKAERLWLRRARNIAWFTAGADATIPTDIESAVYTVLVTPQQRMIYSNNIEITRLRAEEDFESLGFEYVEFAWHETQEPDHTKLLADDGAVDEALRHFRAVLLPSEQERFRALGTDTAAALDEAIRAAQPGDTEFEIAARLDAAARKRGGLAVVNLVGTDERISKFRHPLITDKRLDQYLMMVLCMRRGGLVAAATRLAHFGPLPAELEAAQHKIAMIDAAVIAASQPGRTVGAVFSQLRTAYADQGEADQWRLHHQGGLIAYNSRESIAIPGDPTELQLGHALAWNPSIAGCKSEDTILLTEAGQEIITAASEQWPLIAVEVDGQTIDRPGILQR